MAKLGDICFQITDGSHNPPAGIENSKHLMLSSKNINDDEITTTAPRFLTDEQFDIENKRTNVLSGDLLMTIVGTVGRVAVVPEMLAGICLQRSVAVIKPNPTIINNRYLMYQLQSMRKFLESEARGVAQKGIYLKQVGDLSVITPPLDEQYRVVDTLDHISGLIHIYQQQLTKLDELIKARFVEMFGNFVYELDRWSTCEIGDVADTIDPQPSHRTPPVSLDGIPYIGIAECNYQTRKIAFKSARKVGKDVLKEHKNRYTLNDGDFIIGKIGTIGKPFFLPTDCDYTLSANTVLIKPQKDKINPRFLFAIFESEYMDRIIDAEKKSTSQPAFGIQKVRSIEIPLPPLSLQNQFAAFVEEVDKSKLFVELFAQSACILAENRSK